MMKTEPNNHIDIVCNLDYLSNLMGGKTHLIKKIIDTFLMQAQEELASINNAILIEDYITIKSMAHTMKSTVSIMSISIALPVLQEIEELSAEAKSIDRITVLNHQLNSICKLAFEELEKKKSQSP